MRLLFPLISTVVEETDMECVDVIIPSYKPGQKFIDLIKALLKQTYPVNRIIVMNTEEAYFDELRFAYPEIESIDKLDVFHIKKSDFDHGKTRNAGVKKSSAPFFIMMTDDAIPADDKLIERLMNALINNKETAVAYARQICGKDADPFEIFARQFNYPEQSCLKGKDDIETLGIKTFFCSNVCAAYKRDVFDKLGGFVYPTIFNEDMIYAAGAVDAGYKIDYVAEAQVIHFHRYSNVQQFTRNFDLAVSQADHPEVFDRVSSESEGIKLVKTQIAYLFKQKRIWKIPGFVMQSGCKFLGYKLGKKYSKLPMNIVKKCSMNKAYWQ